MSGKLLSVHRLWHCQNEISPTPFREGASSCPCHSPAGCVWPETLWWFADCRAAPTAPPEVEVAPPTAVYLFLSARTAGLPPVTTAARGGVAWWCMSLTVRWSLGGAYLRLEGSHRLRWSESQRGSRRVRQGHSDPEPPPAGPLPENTTAAPPEWRTNGRCLRAGSEPCCHSNLSIPVFVAASWHWAADPRLPGNVPPSTKQHTVSFEALKCPV